MSTRISLFKGRCADAEPCAWTRLTGCYGARPRRRPQRRSTCTLRARPRRCRHAPGKRAFDERDRPSASLGMRSFDSTPIRRLDRREGDEWGPLLICRSCDISTRCKGRERAVDGCRGSFGARGRVDVGLCARVCAVYRDFGDARGRRLLRGCPHIPHPAGDAALDLTSGQTEVRNRPAWKYAAGSVAGRPPLAQ